MVIQSCDHSCTKKFGKDWYGNQRHRCGLCGKVWNDVPAKPLGEMRVPVETAKMALRLLTEGMSIRSTERITKLHRDTICKLIVFYGAACRRFLDKEMRGLRLTHLQFDEQWCWVGKKQGRLTIAEKRHANDQGEIYIWTCIDEKSKLLPSFFIGKRGADNARRFMVDVAGRLVFPEASISDAHAYKPVSYPIVCQVSTDGYMAYPEAVDLAFGPYVKYGQIIKVFRNSRMLYSPSEMVGTERTPIKRIDEKEVRTITTSHVERLNCTQRLFLKRLNRLTLCYSKKLANLEAAFSMFAAYYNFCWRTRKPGKSGQKRPTAAMMAGIVDHVWSFDELFDEVLKSATQC